MGEEKRGPFEPTFNVAPVSFIQLLEASIAVATERTLQIESQ